MKHILSITLFLLLTSLSFSQIVTDSNYCADIKTVVIGPTELRLGDIFDSEGPQTTLSFDILGPQPAHLHYRIRHCNAEWIPDNLDDVEFVNGIAEGNIENYQASFNTRTDYIHYEQIVPGEYNRLTASGKTVIGLSLTASGKADIVAPTADVALTGTVEGQPLDIDVYDSATWSVLAGLTEESVNRRGAPVDVPDFTRGGWKTAKPLGVMDIDVDKLDLSRGDKT